MKHYHFENISSTNDYARELLEKESPVIVSADFQFAGRGRNQKNWEGNYKDNVYCSFGIKHTEQKSAVEVSAYQALGCLAVKYILKEITGSDIFRIKYPNDIVVITKGGIKKLAGILVENGYTGSFCNYSIVGIGINVQQDRFDYELAKTVTSLSLLGFSASPDVVLEKLSMKLEQLSGMYHHKLFLLWKKELNIEGKEIMIQGEEDKWIVEKLNHDGTLLAVCYKQNRERLINDGDSIRYF